MNEDRRRTMQAYVAEIEAIANRAEQLESTVDEPYKLILQTEVEGYRRLIELWQKRLDEV